LVPKIERIGPGTCYLQWTIEHSIGNLTQEMWQHVTPYANLSQIAVKYVEVNALKAMIPSLDKDAQNEGQISQDGFC